MGKVVTIEFETEEDAKVFQDFLGDGAHPGGILSIEED